MRRLAELPVLWRYILLAAIATSFVSALRCIDTRSSTHATTAIHVKYRPGKVQLHAHAGQVVRPLFQHLRTTAAHDDVRLRWVRIEVPSDRAGELLAELARDPDVETALVPPVVSLPRVSTLRRPADGESCPIHTPSYEAHQGYLGPAPHGIDAPAAWRRGVLGQGVWFADIEGGWNAKHEDLPGDRIFHVSGRSTLDRSWRAHGTAVLGEVVGRDNGKGVVGIAPEVERVVTSSIFGTTVAEAIDAAAENLRPGDVLLIELQGIGPRRRFLPMEFWDDNFDVIKTATDRGVIVVEAAGNGNEDLDHKTYGGKLSRSGRDSGAIMVGAGGPPRDGFDDRAKLDFSNYGSRVDVQGWGRKVATLDYGDLQSCAGVENDQGDRDYTNEFAGTSSASPIVAGAAVLLQSYAKQHGRVLSPHEIRDILAHTGSPQTSDPRKNIGPRPDLARALLRVQRYATSPAGFEPAVR